MRAFVTAAFLAASAAAYAQPSGQQHNSSNPAPTSQQQNQSSQQNQQGQPQTFTGCLTSAESLFTLTVADPPIPGATATTVAYTLKPSGNVDLKRHVNQKVEVKGIAVSTDDAARVVDTTGSRATGTSGSSGGGTPPNTGTVTPRVETTAKAQIVARTLNVTSIRELASNCDPIAK
jgi:hypothetical protein